MTRIKTRREQCRYGIVTAAGLACFAIATGVANAQLDQTWSHPRFRESQAYNPMTSHRAVDPPVDPDVPIIPNMGMNYRPGTMRELSWIVTEKPAPRQIRIHDILTITVDDKSEMIVDNRFNRSRLSQLKAELKEFIRISDGTLENAASNSPKIDANLQSRLNSQGQIQSSEGIKYIVAATVVDIRPNGNLVLEAKKRVRANNDIWEYRLTGEIRPDKINRDFTAISEDIANMYIEKNQAGKVHQSTKRPWGVVLYDWLSPF